MAISFGVVSGATCSYGTVNSAEKSTSAEIAEARNATGAVTNEQAYSRTTTGKLTAVMTSAVPEAGTALTIFGVAGLAANVRTIESNTGYRMVEAETVLYDAATQLPIT